MEPLSAVVLFIIAIMFLSFLLRRVVAPNYAHVVVRNKSISVYSSHSEISPERNAVYYYFPSWVPYLGMYVMRMPLENLEVHIPDYVTFAKNNARFQCSVSVYMRIQDVTKAARRFPTGELEQFIIRVRELVVAAIRNTTTEFNAEDVIAKKSEIADRIQSALQEDLGEWGVHIINAAVVDISDPSDATVIQDISAKKEAEINAESRKIIAVKTKEAEIVEYENTEKAETRKWQMDEAIQMREKQKDQKVQIEAQKAKTEQMRVIEIQNVRQAEIDKKARIEKAEGERKSLALVGIGEAEAIKAKGDAVGKAKEAEARGLNALAKAGETFRLIEKEEKIGLALAQALTDADLRFINAGPINSFADLFSPKGGAQIGGMLEALSQTNPKLYEKLTGEILGAADASGDDEEEEYEEE